MCSLNNYSSLFDFMSKLLNCNTVDCLTNILSGMHYLFDHKDILICMLKTMESEVIVYKFLNISFPEKWLQYYQAQQLHLMDPIITQQIQLPSVIYWDDVEMSDAAASDFLDKAREFGISGGCSCGITNYTKNERFILSVSGVKQKAPQIDYILNILTPHIHQAYVRTSEGTLFPGPNLSKREKEILNWAKKGKSSWEMSKILGITVRTVKFHFNNIFNKLDAVSRTQAVAIALSRGLIND